MRDYFFKNSKNEKLLTDKLVSGIESFEYIANI